VELVAGLQEVAGPVGGLEGEVELLGEGEEHALAFHHAATAHPHAGRHGVVLVEGHVLEAAAHLGFLLEQADAGTQGGGQAKRRVQAAGAAAHDHHLTGRLPRAHVAGAGVLADRGVAPDRHVGCPAHVDRIFVPAIITRGQTGREQRNPLNSHHFFLW
jgi:hypothetical protein